MQLEELSIRLQAPQANTASNFAGRPWCPLPLWTLYIFFSSWAKDLWYTKHRTLITKHLNRLVLPAVHEKPGGNTLQLKTTKEKQIVTPGWANPSSLHPAFVQCSRHMMLSSINQQTATECTLSTTASSTSYPSQFCHSHETDLEIVLT